MVDSYPGVHTVYVDHDAIQEIYANKSIPFGRVKNLELSFEDKIAFDLPLRQEIPDWTSYQNLFVVLTSFAMGEKATAIGRVKGDGIQLIKDFTKAPVFGLKPRNKEQSMLLNSLTDEDVRCQVITGKAGSGKSILALATALHLLFEREKTKKDGYEKIILTRPMEPVGRGLGFLPGTADEKFLPYLSNYFDNIECLMGSNGRGYLERAVDKGQIEFMPIALIGGASWHRSIVIADEIQSLTAGECYAIGTRIAAGSKLIMMGDFKQRYGKLGAVEETGLYRLVNSEVFKRSRITASLTLLKIERSELAKVFDDAFPEL